MIIRRSRRGTILIVDEEPAIRCALGHFLEEFGYQTLTVSSGEQALDIVRRRRPPIDLVVSDLGTGDLHGVALVTLCLAEWPPPAVLLMTGRTHEPEVWLPEPGVTVQVVRKPPNLDELRNVIDRLVPELPPVADDLPGGE